jgi:predicted component of type VI protein secretion system
MQKVINGIALLSGLVSLSIVSAGAYLYMNKDAMIQQAKEQAIDQITQSISEALPGIINEALPEMPEVPELPAQTGGVLPF